MEMGVDLACLFCFGVVIIVLVVVIEITSISLARDLTQLRGNHVAALEHLAMAQRSLQTVTKKIEEKTGITTELVNTCREVDKSTKRSKGNVK